MAQQLRRALAAEQLRRHRGPKSSLMGDRNGIQVVYNNKCPRPLSQLSSSYQDFLSVRKSVGTPPFSHTHTLEVFVPEYFSCPRCPSRGSAFALITL